MRTNTSAIMQHLARSTNDISRQLSKRYTRKAYLFTRLEEKAKKKKEKKKAMKRKNEDKGLKNVRTTDRSNKDKGSFFFKESSADNVQ